MVCYSAYLETADDGACLAHVLDLPGCTARGESRDEALSHLPQAIHDYAAWLRCHGEPAPPLDASIEIQIAEEIGGLGPFDPGDAAALFAPDREPVSVEEMEARFRLMAHTRADLLSLVVGLPDELLDWQPAPDEFSIRRIVRHIGNAEEWYVSRLVLPETLPPEWEDDEGLPLLEFLGMERRTAVVRLRQLNEAERSGVFYPAQWTNHPEEAWTARKVLRRFLEHEREHTAQVQAVLAQPGPKMVLLAALEAAREELLAAMALIPAGERAIRLVCGEWTLKDVAGHLADWEWLGVDGLRQMAAGQPPQVELVTGIDAWNAAHVQVRRSQSWTDVWDDLHAARRAFREELEAIDQATLLRVYPFPWGVRGTAYHWACVYLEHDREHARGLCL